MNRIRSMARAVASDDPDDFDRLSRPMQEYWERIAGRAFIHLAREKKAKAEMTDYLDHGSEAA